jgi:hypothetical protein
MLGRRRRGRIRERLRDRARLLEVTGAAESGDGPDRCADELGELLVVESRDRLHRKPPQTR